ncbi:26S proteasome regulatory subunit 4-like protein A [Colletotrichum siamense]|uniref:26S proteasome regulatory subunit 4-like protein A n=1 Tax=Colletotrichum siamense TaxID=690259 RepID=A0A9P5EME6_COLSI|nr:26S proteasome regulatory subunit 4-like protein A [Colletotrichum siamense]KAF4853994.1 26S proteasome regulatory subunit 4-like protein A [Colletotrichum siamense]
MDTPDSYSSAAYSSDDSRPQRPPRRRSRSSDDEEKTKLTDIGQTPEVKEFYRKSRRDLWEDWAPEYIGLAGSAAASAKFALIARREVNVEATDGNVLALHSVIVNSPHIKRALGDVFQGYPGVSTTLKKVEFKAPFQPFFHRWRALQKCVEDEEEVDELARQHVKLLYDVLAPEIKPQIERARDLRKNEVVSFDYLWTLFEPDTEAYARVDDQDRLFLVKNARYEPRSDGSVVFTLKCQFVDTDGIRFGLASKVFEVHMFDDLLPIRELAIYPSNLHPGMKKIREKLEARGKLFESYKGFHYKGYSGMFEFGHGDFKGVERRQIEHGRIIIDGESYCRYEYQAAPRLKKLRDPKAEKEKLSALKGRMKGRRGSYGLPYSPPRRGRMRYVESATAGLANEADKELTANQRELASPMVRGFDLTSKKWGLFFIDSVTEVEWNEGAFDQLVLPHDYKTIVRAFVEAQMSSASGFDDIIRGKGQGIIMLLSGEPGVGKTLTAESMAEAMKKPLYAMSAGELGITADDVEDSLRRVLEMCTKWQAVLLLDECDIFLEKRRASDLQRNQIVSVFLRLLEYYKGVMLLTTNRVEAFDPAFESRIHLTINYPALDFDSRLHVWKVFIDRRKADESGALEPRQFRLEEEDFKALAKLELNGREIKNVVKTASLLALRDGAPLGMEHVRAVLRVRRGKPAAVGSIDTGLEDEI